MKILKKSGFPIWLTITLNQFAAADSGAYLNFENNCSYLNTFQLSGATSGSYVVAPNHYTNQFISAGKLTTNSTANYQVTTQNGSIDLQLMDAWTFNSMTFSNINQLASNLSSQENVFKWHGIPIIGEVGTFIGTPTFTITSCPYQPLNISNIDLLNNVKRIVIFGDSLSDDGNLLRADAGILPKSTPYYDGMFSNGNPWSMKLKQVIEPSGIALSNYAVGGAVAVFHLQEKLPYSLDSEYQAYLLNSSSFSESPDQRLAIILIGANDYLSLPENMSTTEMENKTDDVINTGINSAVVKLITQGINKIVFFNLPDLGRVPECTIDKDCQTLSAITQMHNKKLSNYVASLPSKYNNQTFKLIDIASVFNLAINDTNSFNTQYQTSLKNVTTACWTGGYTKKQLLAHNANLSATFNGIQYPLPNNMDILETLAVGSSGSICENPEEHLFWDHIHPTYQLHHALFKYFIQQIGGQLLSQ